MSDEPQPMSATPAPPEAAPPVEARLRRPPRGQFTSALIRTVRTRIGLLGLVILAVLVAIALSAPFLAPYDPLEQHPGFELATPGVSGFILGTDEFGRDLLSRIMWGARVSFSVALIAVGVGSVAGVLTGLLAGYFGGVIDSLIMRVYDVILSFPGILVGIAVVSVLGPSSINVSWALAVGLTPTIARLTRSSVLRERENDYVIAARCCGARDRRIMWIHIFPNTVAPLLVQVSLALGFTVLSEAGLSFLGLGTQPPQPSWGMMLNTSRAYLRDAPWYGVWPGIALAFLVFGLNSFSDALRDALDPRMANL